MRLSRTNGDYHGNYHKRNTAAKTFQRGWTSRFNQKGLPPKEFTGKTKAEAKKKLDDWKIKVAIEDVIKSNIKVSQYADKYLSRKLLSVESGHYKQSSYDRVEYVYRCHLQNNEVLKKAFPNITAADIASTINAKKDSLSYSSLKKIYNFWTAMIKHAKETGELPPSYNIMKDVELPDESVLAVQTKEIEIIPEKYVPIIKEIAMSPSPNPNERFLYKYGPVIVFLLNTGLRGGEMLALGRSSCVKTGNRYAIQITRTLSRVINREKDAKSKTKLILTKPKFPNSVRTIPLNKEAEYCWFLMQDLYDENLFNKDLVIASENDWPPNLQILRNTLINICKRAGAPKRTLHAIRHYFATKIVRKAKNMGELKDVAEFIGDSYEVIINTYFHTDEGRKAELIDSILEDDEDLEAA